jgi:hypothetical protein
VLRLSRCYGKAIVAGADGRLMRDSVRMNADSAPWMRV